MGIFRDDDEPKKSRITQTGAPPARKSLPLLPLRDIVVFPHMVVPLFVGRQKSIEVNTPATCAICSAPDITSACFHGNGVPLFG